MQYFVHLLSISAISENYVVILTIPAVRALMEEYGKDAVCPIYMNASDEVRYERAKNRPGFDASE